MKLLTVKGCFEFKNSNVKQNFITVLIPKTYTIHINELQLFKFKKKRKLPHCKIFVVSWKEASVISIQVGTINMMKINLIVLVSKVHCGKHNGPERNCSRDAAKSLNNAVMLQYRVFICKPSLNTIFYTHFLTRVVTGNKNCVRVC